ncbi:hypothetical protein Tco_0294623 [Tanacetum coccineum]
MEAHLAPTQPTQVNKITSSCEIYSGPHDTRYYMENPEQAFVEYASLRTDEVGVFEADFKQQQSEITNKIDTVLKAITYRLAGSLPRDTVKNPKLNTSLVLSARSYPTEDPQCSTQIYSLINVVTMCPKQPNEPQNNESEGEDREKRSNPENIDTTSPLPHDPSILFITEKIRKLNSFLESSGWVPQSSDTEIVCTKGDDGEVMFIEIIRKNDDSCEERPKDEGSMMIERLVPSCFVIFDLEPLSLSLRLRSLNLFLVCLDRLCHLAILCLDQHAHTLHHLESLLKISLNRLDILKEDLFNHEHVIQRISLTGFLAQSVGSSNTDVLDLPCLLVLITEMSQSRQHVDTSLIHIESRKSPTKSLFDVGSSRISIFIVNTLVSLGCSGKITRIIA